MNEMIAQRYLLVQEIGHGGMADVYLAMDTVLKREVAIKILRGSLSTDPISLLRFQREANAASALTHPNIVEIYDVGEYEGKQFIVMEYVRGKTLKQLIAKRGALPVNEAVTIMKQLIGAVNEAHTHGIIHRDIKPQNVLVKDDGTIKITDFGIALAQDAVQLTQTDSVMGSVHYLAPEVARGDTASAQSDIYSLGIVFYELLCGDVPFRADSPIQIAMMHVQNDMPSIREKDNTIPQSVENIIIHSTAKNKVYRYGSSGEMLADVETCLSEKRAKEAKYILGETGEDGTIKVARLDGKTEETNKPKKNLIALIIGLILIIFAIIGMIVIMALNTNSGTKVVELPDFSGHTVEEIRAEVESLGLVVGKSTFKVTDDVEDGLIVSTSPVANSSVEKGTSINFIVSNGMYFVVDDYVNMNIDEVKELLATHKNIDIRVESQGSETVEPGTILEQSGINAGDKCDPNRSYIIKFVVSDYVGFTMPTNLIRMNIYQAQQILEEMGATVQLYPKDPSGLTEADLNNRFGGANVVVEVSPSSGYYVQKEDNQIVLYYYPGYDTTLTPPTVDVPVSTPVTPADPTPSEGQE